jgi:hypothetical protein
MRVELASWVGFKYAAFRLFRKVLIHDENVAGWMERSAHRMSAEAVGRVWNRNEESTVNRKRGITMTKKEYSSTQPPRLGFTGMRHMASHKAHKLLAAGYPMTVNDRTKEKAQAQAPGGGR